MELAADEMQQSILLSTIITAGLGLLIQTQEASANTRRLFNRAKMTGDWDLYRNALIRYNIAIRKAKETNGGSTVTGLIKFPLVLDS